MTANLTFAQDFQDAFQKDEPVFISSDSLKMELDKRAFFYEGNVELLSGELNILSKKLSGTYNEKNEITELIATGSVSIQNGPSTFAQAEHAYFQQKTQTIELTQNPSITQEGSVLSADAITLFLEDNRSEATGEVRVKLKESSTSEQNEQF